jgi:predicted lysophospholipase L1 biosynthesis ABC-type transport system permease subunit
MESIRATQKKYGTRAMSTAVILALIFILAGQTALGKGLVLGALFSVINFVLMGEALPLKLGRSSRRTYLFSVASLFLRYLILAAPLVVAVKYEQFHLVTTVAGIFMVQFMILAEHLGKYIHAIPSKTS